MRYADRFHWCFTPIWLDPTRSMPMFRAIFERIVISMLSS